MSRNKSVNEDRTKEALKFYYEKAQNLGLVDQITQVGGFKEDAIKTAISRGRVSQVMIDSFVQVIGANSRNITGEEPMPNSTVVDADIEEVVMTDEQMMLILQSVLSTQDIGNTLKKKNAINVIKNVLNQF